jgi:hypothetical protein
MPIDVGPNRSAMMSRLGGQSPSMRPPNSMRMGGPNLPMVSNQPIPANPSLGVGLSPNRMPQTPLGGFFPSSGPPSIPPPQTGGIDPIPQQNMPIDTAPGGYTDPNNASIPNISMGTSGGQGANRMGGALRNAYAGAGPNLSTQPFRNKLFY